VVRHGQMNLVDLAGSECVGRSGNNSKSIVLVRLNKPLQVLRMNVREKPVVSTRAFLLLDASSQHLSIITATFLTATAN